MISQSCKGITTHRMMRQRFGGFEHMNTDKFDKHAKANLAFYEGFMNFTKYTIVAIVITLALMAYFLV